MKEAYSYFTSQLIVSERGDPVPSDFRRGEWWGEKATLRGPTGMGQKSQKIGGRAGWAREGGWEPLAQPWQHKSWNLPLGGGEGEKKPALSCVDWGTKRSEERTLRHGSEREGRSQGSPWLLAGGTGTRGRGGLSNGTVSGTARKRDLENTFLKSFIVSVILGQVNWPFFF